MHACEVCAPDKVWHGKVEGIRKDQLTSTV